MEVHPERKYFKSKDWLLIYAKKKKEKNAHVIWFQISNKK